MTPQRAVVAVAVWLGVGTGDDVTVLVCVFDGVDVDVPVFVGVLVEVGVQVGVMDAANIVTLTLSTSSIDENAGFESTTALGLRLLGALRTLKVSRWVPELGSIALPRIHEPGR